MPSLWDDAIAPYTAQPQVPDDSSLMSRFFKFLGWDPASAPSRLNPFSARGDQTPAGNPGSSVGLTPEFGYAAPGTTGGPMQTMGAAQPKPPLPNWPDIPGIPASMRVAPPSMYTAANPEQQARWNQASTPIGYATLASQPMAPASPMAPVARTPASPVPVPMAKPEPPPVIRGGGNIMPPAGGSQGWAGYPYTAPAPSTSAMGAPVIGGPRMLSDADIQAMSYADIGRVVDRPDLTVADRIALLHRLNAMSR